MTYWEPMSESVIRETLRHARVQARASFSERYEMALDYLHNRQIGDVEQELLRRYETTQRGETGQAIQPQSIPLTERYIAEAATAYTKPPKREVFNEDGELDEQTTQELNDALDACAFDEVMQSVDETTLLIGSCGVWFQAGRGELMPTVAYPHDVFPVEPAASDDVTFRPGTADDYAGFILRLYGSMDDPMGKTAQRYAWLSASQYATYEGTDPWTPRDILAPYPNRYVWPQMVDTADGQGAVRTLPLLPFVVWQRRASHDELLLDVDPIIALANRELNIQLSVLMDSLSHQGWSIPVFTLMNPNAAPAVMGSGPRSGHALQSGESAQMMDAGTDYAGIVGALRDWLKMIAIATRQSPNDFAIDGVAPASGFAKLIDSLPKLDARADRIRRLKRTEERDCWPRIASCGSRIGLFTASIEQLGRKKMRVTFPDIQFPLSVSEQVQKDTFELEHNITTPAELLARKNGTTVEQAQQVLDSRPKQQAPAPPPEATPTQPQPQGGVLSRLIGARRAQSTPQ